MWFFFCCDVRYCLVVVVEFLSFKPSKKSYKNKKSYKIILQDLYIHARKGLFVSRSCKALAGIVHKYTCKIPASVLQDPCKILAIKILQNARQMGLFLLECTSLAR